MDPYHTNNAITYPLPQQQQPIDPNDDQHIYLRVHSTSSHSSSASLSPPIITTNNNLTSSSSSASSSSSYSYPHKNPISSSSGGYLHPNANGTLTLYSHHHQHHSDLEALLHLNAMDEEEDDDDDDLLTLVHHHDGMIDDHQQLSSSFPLNNHQLFSHNEPPTSILRTVLKRPIVGKNTICHSTAILFFFLRYAQSTGVIRRFSSPPLLALIYQLSSSISFL